jgi:hypothetical protein
MKMRKFEIAIFIVHGGQAKEKLIHAFTLERNNEDRLTNENE